MTSVDTEVDEVENVVDKDESMINLEDTFTSTYHLAHSVKCGTAYILNVDISTDSSTILSLGSTGETILYSSDLRKVGSIECHEKSVTQAAFSKTDPNIFFTSSHDGTVRLWDVRSPTSSKSEFRDDSKQPGPPSNSTKPILCFDTSPSSPVLCAGTEQIGSDSYLLFWDVRAGNLLGGYWESHSGDITCIRFNPEKGNIFASSDVEGMVNVFDINESDEDEALQTCHNADDSVATMRWFKKKEKSDFLAIATHTESLQVFDTEESQQLHSFSRNDVAHSIRRIGAEHIYIVGLLDQQEQGFLLLAGSRYEENKCLRFSTFKNKKLKPCINLPLDVRSRGLIRDCAQIQNFSGFITGSEGGIVDVWKPGASSKQNSLKIVNKSDHRTKPY